MNHHVSPPPRARELRSRARAALNGHWPLAVIVTLLAGLLGAQDQSSIDFSVNLQNELPTDAIAEQLQQLEITASFDALRDALLALLPILVPVLISALLFSLAVSLVFLLIGGCIRLGQCRFQLALLDGADASAGLLFSGFKTMFFKGLILRFVRSLYIFLWSLLFIVPGIIAVYRYSMADYALAENPDMGVMDALRESKRMMRGNKWRLFCLQLSFIGWQILSLFTLGVGQLWLNPYVGQAEAAFYHEVSGRAAVRAAVLDLGQAMEGL